MLFDDFQMFWVLSFLADFEYLGNDNSMKYSMRLLSSFVLLPFFLVSCGDNEEVKSPQESEQGISNSSDISNNRIEISEQENSFKL